MAYKNYILSFLLLIAIFAEAIYAQPVYWINQPTPVNQWLYSCNFVDTSYGWAGGDSGTILFTSNGGQNWIKQITNTADNVNSIFFINRFKGFAIGNRSTLPPTSIFKTTNSGLNWIYTVFPDSQAYINSVYFLDSLNGWLVGFGGDFRKTTDGGNTWIRKDVDSTLQSHFPVRDIRFYSNNYGYGIGGAYDYGGVMWRTTNGGEFWNTFIVAPEPVFSIHFFDSTRIIGAGGDFEFGASTILSTDAGNSWNYYALYLWGVARSIAYRTSTEAWAPTCFSGNWILSLDAGKTWQDIDVPDSAAMYYTLFVDSLHGWSVGTFGRILKYNRSVIGINNNQNNLPTSPVLYQNYPNPFNPTTTIKYYLNKPSDVKLILYDALGKEIKYLINQFQSSGDHKIYFESSKLSSGVYFYKLVAGNYTQTNKMLIIK